MSKPVDDLSTAAKAERIERMQALEARMAQPPSVGVMPGVAALALCLALVLLFMQRRDAAYFFSSKEPLELGSEGAYRFELLASNRYVQIHGVPGLRGAYGTERGGPFVVIAVSETPILMKRRLLPGEQFAPGTVPPRPDARAFTAAGRLLSREEATKYQDAFDKHQSFGGPKPQWILLEGERPGGDFGAMTFIGAVAAFAALNAWLLVRGLIRFFSAVRR